MQTTTPAQKCEAFRISCFFFLIAVYHLISGGIASCPAVGLGAMRCGTCGTGWKEDGYCTTKRHHAAAAAAAVFPYPPFQESYTFFTHTAAAKSVGSGCRRIQEFKDRLFSSSSLFFPPRWWRFCSSFSSLSMLLSASECASCSFFHLFFKPHTTCLVREAR